jgi:hypothetical protein
LKGLRTLRAIARFGRFTRLARVFKQFRPIAYDMVPGVSRNPYFLLFLGNAIVLVAASIILSWMEKCSFLKALSWSAQVFYSGESFYTQLQDPKAQRFGDLIKIPGVAFYALLIGLVPDMIQRLKRFATVLFGARLNGHYVIFGWNRPAYSLIKTFLNFFPGVRNRIVVLDEEEEPEDLKELGIRYMKSSLSRLWTLQRANIRKARVVIVPPNRHKIAFNDEIEKHIFLLASHLATNKGKAELIACTESSATCRSVIKLGGTAIDICRFGGHILSQTLLKSGIEKVYEQILSYDRSNIYVEPVPRHWAKSRWFLMMRLTSPRLKSKATG